MIFQLKLTTGRVVEWEGKDGVDAAKSYAGSHPDTAVVAWRWPRPDLRVGMIDIIEPGDWRWGKPS